MFEACREVGFAMTEDLFLSMIGSPRDANAQRLLERFGADFPVDAYYDACHRGFEIACADSVPLRPGAERLLGKGDLFFLSVGDPVRLQSPYLSPQDRARIFS